MRASFRHVQPAEDTNESKSKLLGAYLRDHLLANITSHEPAKELVKRSFRYNFEYSRVYGAECSLVLLVSSLHLSTSRALAILVLPILVFPMACSHRCTLCWSGEL